VEVDEMLKFCDPSTLSKFFRGIFESLNSGLYSATTSLTDRSWHSNPFRLITKIRFKDLALSFLPRQQVWQISFALFCQSNQREKSEHVTQYPTIKAKAGEEDKAECLIGE
jgi:hypothetical protein